MISPHPPLSHRDSEPRPVAIVTGSSQGLGLSIALRLADDGCDIVINDLPFKLEAMEDAVRRIALKGARAVAVAADVSCEDEVKRLIEITVEKLGKLDIVRLSLRILWMILSTDLSLQMVANAGVVVMKSLLQSQDTSPYSVQGTDLKFLDSISERFRLAHECQHPGRHVMLQVCCSTNDQTRRWRKNNRFVYFFRVMSPT